MNKEEKRFRDHIDIDRLASAGRVESSVMGSNLTPGQFSVNREFSVGEGFSFGLIP